MKIKTVTPEAVTLPLDKFPHIEFGVTLAAVTPKCLMCGRELKSARRKTCDQNCRKAASRRHEAIRREVDNVREHLAKLASFSDRWPDLNAEIMDAMNQCVTAATVTYFDRE